MMSALPASHVSISSAVPGRASLSDSHPSAVTYDGVLDADAEPARRCRSELVVPLEVQAWHRLAYPRSARSRR